MQDLDPNAVGAEGAVDVDAGGEPVRLLPSRAVWWPRARTLLIADVHLGKEESHRLAGVPLPEPLSDEPLARLAASAGATRADRVIVVGDLLHDRAGLTGRFVERVAAWRRGLTLDLAVVPGNHDTGRLRRVADAWGLTLLPGAYAEGPFGFVHDPDAARAEPVPGARFTWSGHLHPAVSLGGRAPVRLPAFLIGPRAGVLPAFTAFASGVTPRRRPGERLYPIADGRVLPP